MANWSIWDDVPGLDYDIPLPANLKREWIDQDGMPHAYETLDADDPTMCKRRKLNPKYENAYLKPDGSVVTDHASIVAVQRAWLDRKAERAGFRVLDCRVSDRGFQVSRKGDGAPPLRHLCVDFEGVLQVTDPDRFLAAMRSGIGSAKGFGFGLLSIARG